MIACAFADALILFGVSMLVGYLIIGPLLFPNCR